MVCIFVGEAILRLKFVNAPFTVEDNAIVTTSQNNGFKRIRRFLYQDSIGSLVSANEINKEIEYWQNNK